MAISILNSITDLIYYNLQKYYMYSKIYQIMLFYECFEDKEGL